MLMEMDMLITEQVQELYQAQEWEWEWVLHNMDMDLDQEQESMSMEMELLTIELAQEVLLMEVIEAIKH